MKRTETHIGSHSQGSPRGIVGFVVDGVLTNEMVGEENIWQREIEAYFPELQLREPNFSFTAAYGLTMEKVEEFMQERAPSIFREVKPQVDCRALLARIQKMGLTIHLITARETRYEEITRRWLAQYDIPYTDLWFEDAKGMLCKDLGIEVFVDDYWDNCLDIRNHGAIALLMLAPHNRGYQTEKGIYRVKNWEEIGAYLGRYFGLQWDSMKEIPGA